MEDTVSTEITENPAPGNKKDVNFMSSEELADEKDVDDYQSDDEDVEEEEYQPKKRAAVKRKMQTVVKTNIKKMSKPKENGGLVSGRPKGPGRPRGPGRPKGTGRPGRPTVSSSTKLIAQVGRRKRKQTQQSVVCHLGSGAEENQTVKVVEEEGEDENKHLHSSRKKSKRIAVKKVKPATYVDPQSSETDEDYDYEVCEYSGHRMAIKPSVFHEEVLEAVSKWEMEWTKKEAEEAVNKLCTQEGCHVNVPARDMAIHVQCHTEDGFRCARKSCDYMHSEWQNVRTHISKMHRSLLEIWKCDQPDCGKHFSRWVSLRRHIMYKHIYESTTEILALQNPTTKEDEEKKVKKIKREPDVPPALRKKPRRKPVVAHPKKIKKIKKEVPKNKPLKCIKCFATYKGEDALKEHMDRHTQVIYTKCAECDEYFTEAKMLQKHLKESHGQLLHTHRCPLCSYTSSYVSDLKIHGYTHQDTKFDCDCCGQVCANPKTLRSHRMRKHPDQYEDKNLICSFCGESCPNEVLLQDHARDKHHLRLNGAKRVNTKEELRFPCTLCDYVGRKQKSLDYHMRLHQEERPFKCSHCNYASKTQNNLKLHMRTHKEMAPLKCPQCEFRGATNKVINQHVMSKHTKEKPYKCCVCSWSTCYSGNLWTHMQIHRKKDGIEIPERPKTRKRPQRQSVPENVTLDAISLTTTTALQQADLATAGLTQSVLTSAGLTAASLAPVSLTPASLTPSSLTTSVLTSTTPVTGPIPISVSSHLSAAVTVPVSLSIDQLPVIQMTQPLLQQQQQQTLVQTHPDTMHQVQHRYVHQFPSHMPPVTEAFQIGPEPNHAQMVDIQIHDSSRRSVVGTIPRQADDDMETVQQLVNLSNMLPSATSVLHNMQPAYARY